MRRYKIKKIKVFDSNFPYDVIWNYHVVNKNGKYLSLNYATKKEARRRKLDFLLIDLRRK